MVTVCAARSRSGKGHLLLEKRGLGRAVNFAFFLLFPLMVALAFEVAQTHSLVGGVPAAQTLLAGD